MRVMVFGARGRMGQALQKAIAESSSCTLVAAVGRGDQVPTPGVDLVIDFSSDEGAKSALAASERLSVPLLMGTTALSQHTLEALQRVASRVPVMVTSNASLGVAVLHRMADLATRVLVRTGVWR
jgi:4-hydroxy-tetrahydrodipicolinate reductase